MVNLYFKQKDFQNALEYLSKDYGMALKQKQTPEIVGTFQASPSPERAKYTTIGHGRKFSEVRVDEDLEKL